MLFLDWRCGDWGGRMLWNAQTSASGCLLPPASPAQDTWEATCRISGYQKWGPAACGLKAKKRGKVGGKKSLLYFGYWQPGEDGLLSTGCLPPHPLIAYQWARALYRQRERAMCRNSNQLCQSSWNWSCGGLISVILIVLSTVNLQFQSRFVSISLRPVLGIVAAYVMATVCSSGS